MLDGQLEPGGAVAIAKAHHGLDLVLIAALFQSRLELILGWNVGRIVLVHLLRSVSICEPEALPGGRTRLYEFSRKVAMVAAESGQAVVGGVWCVQLQWRGSRGGRQCSFSVGVQDRWDATWFDRGRR